MIFLVIFIVIPIIEIALFIEVGEQIGLLTTLLVCFLTAVIGAGLIRMQGLSTYMTAQGRMARNELPVKEMFDGICLAFAGAVLITPGFFTDAVGFLLLVPPFRDFLREYILSRYDVKTFFMGGTQSSPRKRQNRDSNIIDAEYERIDDDDKP